MRARSDKNNFHTKAYFIWYFFILFHATYTAFKWEFPGGKIELGEQAEKMLSLLTAQYAAAENVTEEMKAADQMGWVRAMNSIRNRAEEVVLSELVYC